MRGVYVNENLMKKQTQVFDVPALISPFWELLSEEEKKELLPLIVIKTFAKHELIYAEGESPEHLLCLLSGKVRIYKEGVSGRNQIMRILRTGQYFGYRASIASEPYVTAAAAFEASVICEIPMTVIIRMMQNNNRLCMFFVKELACDLGLSDQRTVSLTQKHVRGRIAEALLYLKDIYGTEPDGKTLSAAITRDELGQLANMTTANSIRTISGLVKERILQIAGKHIRIIDEMALRRISRQG